MPRELVQRLNRLAGQMGYALHLLHPLVDGGGRSNSIASEAALRSLFELAEHGRAAGGEKGKDVCRLLLVPLIGAALVAGREAHLHLRIDTAGKGRIGVELLDAPAQQKQVQHLIRVALGRRARREWAEESVRRRLGDLGCGVNPRIRIVERHAQKGWRAKTQPPLCPFTERAQGSCVKAQGRFEVGAGDAVLNVVDHVRQLQALRLRRAALGSAQKAHADGGAGWVSC